MTYTVDYTEEANVIIDYSAQFNPEEYLDYDTEEEVEEAILEVMSEDVDYGDGYCDEITYSEISIPDEFWDEWHQLKVEQAAND